MFTVTISDSGDDFVAEIILSVCKKLLYPKIKFKSNNVKALRPWWLSGFIVQSMAHAKTQVQISLEHVYMVKILNKKELWTCFRLPWNCDIYLMVITELQ